MSDVDNLAGVSDNCRPTDLSELPSASYTTTAEESDVTVNVSHSQPNSSADVIKTATSEDFQVVQSKKDEFCTTGSLLGEVLIIVSRLKV